MPLRLACAAAILILSGATSALAATSSAIPEPSTLVLFGLGAVGVIVGRRGGRSRRD
jgi:hypothetical protein